VDQQSLAIGFAGGPSAAPEEYNFRNFLDNTAQHGECDIAVTELLAWSPMMEVFAAMIVTTCCASNATTIRSKRAIFASNSSIR
jgi:hypothetical protein